jgi:hypothetical protein
MLYLDSLAIKENTRYKTEYIFNKISKFEEQINKDVYEMNVEELQNLFKASDISTKSSIVGVKSALKKYLDWCKARDIIKINLFDKDVITTNMLINQIDDSQMSLYFSEETYNNYKSIIKASLNGTYYLSLFMALWEGICGNNYDDLINLRELDINISNNTIKLYTTNKIKTVTPELIKALLATSQMDTLESITGRLDKLKVSIYYDSIFKCVGKSKTATAEAIARRFIRDNINYKLKDILNNKNISITNIYNSGLIHYMKKKAEINHLNLKDDLLNSNNFNDNLYNIFLYEYGETMSFSMFRFKFKDYYEYIQ